METLITRDSDILREYLTALDSTGRGISPFARLAATLKLARLRRELRSAQLEATDEDVVRLRREIDERLDRTLFRRLISTAWGARLTAFLLQVVIQQVLLLLALLATAAFARFVPPVAGWNPIYPNDQPVFMILFIFLFLFLPPMLGLMTLFGGRYFQAWRATLPATLIILGLAIAATALSIRNNPNRPNPVTRKSSLSLFAEERGASTKSYREWTELNWLTNDPKFQRDYETYLRKGPGRWITSTLKDDLAWGDSLKTVAAYLDGGQDPAGFREWLTDYLSRNRIYSDDRIPQEVSAITGEANQKFLGIWQVEPYLKERDERIYRAYLGSINSSMKKWALLSLAFYTVAFLALYLIEPLLRTVERSFGGGRTRGRSGSGFGGELEPRPLESQGGVATLKQGYYSFPERSHITTPPFFDAPFKLLSGIHRSFVGFAVSTTLIVFVFWAAVYGIDLASGHENASSQVALMRSNLLFAGAPDAGAGDSGTQARLAGTNGAGSSAGTGQSTSGSQSGEGPLAARVVELEQRLEDDGYESDKKLKQQTKLIARQRLEIDSLKGLSSQLQQTTTDLPTQLADLTSRTTAVEARAGESLGEAGSAKQKAESVEKTLTTKLGDVETRATRAADQIGRIADQTSLLQTRTESLEKEFDRRTGQVEARTDELGERTAGLKEREERVDRLQQIAFAAIVSNITSDVDALERRIESAFYRLFSKGEAQRDVQSLRDRIAQLAGELRAAKTDQAQDLIKQLDELSKRVDEIAGKVK